MVRSGNLLKRTPVDCEMDHCLLEIYSPKFFQDMVKIRRGWEDMGG